MSDYQIVSDLYKKIGISCSKFELTKGKKGDIIIKSPDEDDENSTLKTEQCKKK